MCIWISEVLLRFVYRARGLALTIPLAACMSLPDATRETGPGATAAPGRPQKVLQELSLYGGRVVVRGPRGYCIDGDNTRRGGTSTVVVLASCQTLTGQAGPSVDPALLVVSVLPRRAGAKQPTAAAIAQSMAPKRALQTVDGDGLAMVHLDAGGARALPGGDPRYWRGGMLINGHLVGLAAYGRQGSRVAGADGRRLIRQLAETLREASPEMGDRPTAPSGNATPATPDEAS